MTYVVNAKKVTKEYLPGIVHNDGTSRIQTVNSSQNPLYHNLLKKFKEKTGHGVILNTSFNVNEPIVRSPRMQLILFVKQI